MSERIIFVKLGPTGTCLSLRDNEGHNPGNNDLTTDVDPGDIVKWQLDDDSGLFSLENVVKRNDPGTVDLLEEQPANTAQNVFTATVKRRGIDGGAIETYDIWYKKERGGKTIKEDPKLKMRG